MLPNIHSNDLFITALNDELTVIIGASCIIVQAEDRTQSRPMIRYHWHPEYGVGNSQWHYPESQSDVASIEWADHGTRTWIWPICKENSA